MAFTDDDLKRWKEYVDKRDKIFHEYAKENTVLDPPFSLNEFKAIIDRLETAEEYIRQTVDECESCGEPIGETVMSAKAEEAWAKASGRA